LFVQLGQSRGMPLAVFFNAFGQDFHAYRAPVFLLFHGSFKLLSTVQTTTFNAFRARLVWPRPYTNG
jgi:hypothetical protein